MVFLDQRLPEELVGSVQNHILAGTVLDGPVTESRKTVQTAAWVWRKGQVGLKEEMNGCLCWLPLPLGLSLSPPEMAEARLYRTENSSVSMGARGEADSVKGLGTSNLLLREGPGELPASGW